MFLSKGCAQRDHAPTKKTYIEHMLKFNHFYNFSIFCGMNPKMVFQFILGTEHNAPIIGA